MRMAEREVKDFTTITEIINECECIHLGLISEGEPYVVPLSFGFDADTENEKLVLYFHGAAEGRKIDAIKEHPTAAFAMETGFKHAREEIACTGRSYYRSVMGRGRISFVTDEAEKEHALRQILLHTTGYATPVFSEGGVSGTCVYRMDVDAVSGKQSLEETNKTSKKQPAQMPQNAEELVAYVDGSYDIVTTNFAYGCVVLMDGQEYPMSEAFSDPDLATMRNVAGEIKGAEAAIRYALDCGAKKLTIYYDYEGIAKWPLGQWKANKEGTIAYRDFYREAAKKLAIEFVKVKGHSGDKYNDMADALAKSALGIK